jgi:hypothetical protein
MDRFFNPSVLIMYFMPPSKPEGVTLSLVIHIFFAKMLDVFAALWCLINGVSEGVENPKPRKIPQFSKECVL